MNAVSAGTLRLVRLFLAFGFFAHVTVAQAARPRISEDRDLVELDLTKWDCRDLLEGSAKTGDGVERNRMKNRSPCDLGKVHPETVDSAGFLKRIAEFEGQVMGKHRTELDAPQKQQLETLEKQIVSLSGYLVYAYAGPPETVNCASSDFHDWHLEVFADPIDHPPQIGDPTPIICEISPRTQNGIFRDHVRIQALAGFFRRPDLTYEPTGHKAQKIRLTGFVMWDDDHQGRGDIGTKVEAAPPNQYHHPWRSTAWEIHPVIKIEPLEGGQANSLTTSSPTPVPTPVANSTPPATIASPPPSGQSATLTQPVTIRLPYGQTVLPRGFVVQVTSRDAQTVTIRYLNATYRIPIESADVR